MEDARFKKLVCAALWTILYVTITGRYWKNSANTILQMLAEGAGWPKNPDEITGDEG